MGIEINIPPSLQPLAGDVPQVLVTGRTVAICLRELVGKHPALKSRLFSARGRLLNGINVFINNEDARPGALARRVRDGDKIHIFFPVQGG
jgi:molybdopterin converting factor small subunit